MEPQALKAVVSEGLLSFPLTDFTADGTFEPGGYARRLEWLKPYGASALFAAGGTGELFSLTPDEHRSIVSLAVEVCGKEVPIIAGVGYSTRIAIEMAQAAEKAGAAGILVLPHYLTEADQEGVAAHIEAICKSVKIGVILYNRAVCKLGPAALGRLAERCPNLIGFKDGVGDVDRMTRIYARLGDRLLYVGGLPTAETFALPYLEMGVTTYSSAIFNFLPAWALEFYKAVRARDVAHVYRELNDFVLPYTELRNRRAGYAVSIVKAGMTAVGRSAGPVRTPLADLTGEELEVLKKLIGDRK
jgi:5-dehydro-4-deoxyglucarate dehydratase